jgi:uncharacterized membrane protein (DUF373 family)
MVGPQEALQVEDDRIVSRPAPSRDSPTSRWERWRGLSLQAQFEHAIVLFLNVVIAVIVVLTVWSLALKVFALVLQTGSSNTTDSAVFQSLFGMIFTVIIALEFRQTLLVITERQRSIVHVRAVILIAILAVVRKLILLDWATGGSEELFALAAAILALGAVYWLVRDRVPSDAV